ncbi:hypothetical protein BVRB_1g009170 [Beta vulgaris subsp. vulgaris]|nr:hypothetical protein BVRB_1g009170 [Beta vulgaris subsp. vulgaris]
MEKDFKEDMEGDSKLHNATRCAKAAMLLLSLRNRHHQQEKEMMNQTIDDLKMEVVKERFQKRNLKIFNLLEFTIQIILMFSLLTFFILFAFKSG